MKGFKMLICAAVVLGGSVVAAHAEELAISVQDQVAAPVPVGNKICPVSGEAVGQGGMAPVTYEYKGKLYNLCCGGCIGKFKADPEKYSAIAEGEAITAKEGMKDMPMEQNM